MTDDTNGEAIVKPTPLVALVVLLIVIAALAGWIFISVVFLGVLSFFASFLFLWYWTSVENSKLEQWLPTLVGALVGFCVALLAKYLPEQLGMEAGTILSIFLFAVALYLHIAQLGGPFFNRACILFMTVLAAPMILDVLDPLEMLKAILLGALYFGAIIKGANLLTPTEKMDHSNRQ